MLDREKLQCLFSLFLGYYVDKEGSFRGFYWIGEDRVIDIRFERFRIFIWFMFKVNVFDCLYFFLGLNLEFKLNIIWMEEI